MADLNFSAGDEVRLRLALEEIEGTIVENPEPSIVLLKLESGYNIGIPKENILASRILKKFKAEDKEDKGRDKAVKKQELPSIGLIVTGGTIAAKLNPKKGGVSWLTDISEFRKFYPELFEKVKK